MATQVNKNQIKDGAVRKLLAFSTTQVDIDNTTDETTILSMSVPANTLGSDQGVSGVILGQIKNESANNRTYTVRLKANGNTVATATATITLGRTGSSRIDFLLAGDGDTSTQLGVIDALHGPSDGLEAGGDDATGAGAEDSTAAITLAVTVELSAAHADVEYHMYWYEVGGPYVP